MSSEFTNQVFEVLKSQSAYFKKWEYKGYDPYDLLNSPVFSIFPFSQAKKFQFYSQQVFRRIPINLRPLLGIKKEVNPVTLGLAIQGYSYLAFTKPDNQKEYLDEISVLLLKLEQSSSQSYSGICWGYNFDWAARYTFIGKYHPTVVATGIITNALFEYIQHQKDELAIKLLIGTKDYVLNDLHVFKGKDGACLSYSPFDNQRVINASLKGARLLAQIYNITKDDSLIPLINELVNYAINNQRSDGSWPYSVGDARSWSDNYHTGYVLDALECINSIMPSPKIEQAIKEGFLYYLENFFTNEGIAKYYDNKTYPIDASSVAQSVLTLTRFGYYEEAQKVIRWAINNMYHPDGCFFYQIHKHFRHKTSFQRWSNAWMFSALSYYLMRANRK